MLPLDWDDLCSHPCRYRSNGHQVTVEAGAALAPDCGANAEGVTPSGAATVSLGAAINSAAAAAVGFSAGHNVHSARDDAVAAGASVPALSASVVAAHLPDGPISPACDIDGTEYALAKQDDVLLARLSCPFVEMHLPQYATVGSSITTLLARFQAIGLSLHQKIEDVVQVRRDG